MVEQVCLNEVLIESAKEVFETMIFTDLAETTEPDQNVEGQALLGSITFDGDIEGCLAVCFSMVCAKTIALNMLGMEPDEKISEGDINDAIGEIANMVMGGVKSRLKDNTKNINVSIPTVVSGSELKNSLGDGAERISVMVNIEDEHIAELSLLYRENSK